MSEPGKTERYFIQRLHVSYGVDRVENWVMSNETKGMKLDEALAIAGDDEGNRVILEVTTRTVIPKGHKYGPNNPHPCHQ